MSQDHDDYVLADYDRWSRDWVPCDACDGEGTVHDCGDDTCCCLHPEVDEQVPCMECDGQGGWLHSLTIVEGT